MTTPIHQDFDIHQGETFSFTFKVYAPDGSVVNLTGYSARMSIKTDLVADGLYLATSGGLDGIITLGGAQGTVTIAMTSSQTDSMDETNWFYQAVGNQPSLPIEPSISFLYDLELISGAGAVSCPIQGLLNLWRAVTS